MDKYFLSYNIFREENSSVQNPYKKESNAIVIVSHESLQNRPKKSHDSGPFSAQLFA